MLPTLFISHGSPMLAIQEHQARDFLKELPKSFARPKYIIIVSAHWLTKDLRILANETPSKINDFYGFPEELFNLEYKAKNSSSYINDIKDAFKCHGIELTLDYQKEGYDHGVWAPLSLMYPKADIPVIQISLPIYYEAEELLKIGEVLQKFREQALVIGSGTMTHNIRASNRNIDAKPVSYAEEFRDWIVEKIENGDTKSIESFKLKAPKLEFNHPTLDHFLPLLITIGASVSKKGEALNSIYMYGNQAMDTIIFKE